MAHSIRETQAWMAELAEKFDQSEEAVGAGMEFGRDAANTFSGHEVMLALAYKAGREHVRATDDIVFWMAAIHAAMEERDQRLRAMLGDRNV